MTNIILINGIGKKVKSLIGFKCFIVFKNNEIYGPYIPCEASPSDSKLPSCHAEVCGIKNVISKRKKLKNATLYCVHWSFNDIKNDWELSDGVPCKDCYKFCIKNGIRKFGISSKELNTVIKVNEEYICKKSKFSSGRLYGN